MNRRDFIRTTAAAGAGLWLARGAAAQSGVADPAGAAAGGDLNVALIGAGSQGRVLLGDCLKIPGLRLCAVCDIWEYSRKYSANILRKYGHDPNVYTDFGDLLVGETDLDAVVIATPDFVHAEQTVACLEAGLHVYCEKEMAHTLEGARAMVRAARTAGRLLQIGHQRRSNPRYRHALRLIEKDKVLGRITSFRGQWNRSVQEPLGWPRKYPIDEATLSRYGYDTMERFRNWRWFKRYSGGPISDLGSHQIDIFSWFLKANPKAVSATGGLDYYTGREWYDNVIAIYDYDTPEGTARGWYQVLNTSGFGDFYEAFLGDEGTLTISEDTHVGQLYREVRAKRREWEDDAEKVSKMGREAIELKIGETRTAGGEPTGEALQAVEDAAKPPHQPHLENFFDAIRGQAELTAPAEEAYATAVAILRVNEAVASGERIEFKPEDFVVA